MAEQNEIEKYIKCSKCRCKYINDDDHIKNDFGFNRLNERFKTCVKCRAYTAARSEQRADYGRAYREANREAINEKNRQRDTEKVMKVKELEDDNNKCCGRCRKLKPAALFMVNKFKCKTCDVCRKRDEHRVWSDEWKTAEYLEKENMS